MCARFLAMEVHSPGVAKTDLSAEKTAEQSALLDRSRNFRAAVTIRFSAETWHVISKRLVVSKIGSASDSCIGRERIPLRSAVSA